MEVEPKSARVELAESAAPGAPFADLLGILRRRWPMIAAGVGFGIALAAAYCCVASTKYESTAQILVMKRESSLPARGVEKSNENAMQISEDLLATHMQIVQSPRIIRSALQNHGLEGLESIRRRLKTDQSEVEYIAQQLKLTRGGTGQARLANVLNITFRHVSDVECEQILAAVVESYRNFLVDKFEDVGMEAGKLIAGANSQLGKDLEDAERAYQVCREQTPLMWNGDVLSNTHRVNYERLQSALAEVRVQCASVKTRLDTVKQGIANLKGSPPTDLDVLGLIDENHIERLGLLSKFGAADTEAFQATVPERTATARAEYENLLALTQKEQSLLADYGVEHPLVQDLRKQMVVTRSFLNRKSGALASEQSMGKSGPSKLLTSYVTLLENDLQTLLARRTELEQLSATEEEAAKALVSSELRTETLRTQVVRKQELYETVLDRLREIDLVKNFGGLVTEVIAPVELGEAVWPKVPLLLLLGAMAGLVLGSATALGAEQLDRSLRTAEEVRQLVQVPVLMEVPEFRRPTASALENVPAGLANSLAAYHRPNSFEAEVFRGLRTALFFSGRGGEHRTILCTSANLGDGKTWVASNLAISIAQSGRRVLLIDADLRRPMVHRLFNLPAATGLSHLIADQCDPPDAVEATAVENLWAVPCGAIVDNPSEMLTSLEFARALQVYREQYDYVIIDSPPLLAVSDPCILAPLVDAVVFGVRIGHDTHGQVNRSMELLHSVGANILGVVINGVDGRNKRHFGAARYGFARYALSGDGGANSAAYFASEARSTVGPIAANETTTDADGKA